MKTFVLVSLVLLEACLGRAPQSPGPVVITTAKSRAAIIQAAAAELTAAGFEITADTTAGVLSARRVRARDAQAPDVRCSYPADATAARSARSTLYINVVAQPSVSSRDSTAVTLSSRVTSGDINTTPNPAAQPATDSLCVSTGSIEKQVAAAIR